MPGRPGDTPAASCARYVLTDASLKKQAGRFVWLSIDTEKEKNAAFLAKYPVEVWPTLMVDRPRARNRPCCAGRAASTPAQLVKLLDDGERAAGGGAAAGLGALARADRLNAEGKKKEAAAAYQAALAQLPADKRPRAVESMLAALEMAREPDACAQAAVEIVPPMPRGPSFANAVGTALGCAGQLKGDARHKALRGAEPAGGGGGEAARAARRRSLGPIRDDGRSARAGGRHRGRKGAGGAAGWPSSKAKRRARPRPSSAPRSIRIA